MITAPKPTAPAATIRGVSAARSPRRPNQASSGAASANRTTVSQPPPSQSSESFDSGTVRPHSAPAAARARMAVRFVVMAPVMIGGNRDLSSQDSPFRADDRILFRHMSIPLDSVDIQLLAELQADADRPNV